MHSDGSLIRHFDILVGWLGVIWDKMCPKWLWEGMGLGVAGLEISVTVLCVYTGKMLPLTLTEAKLAIWDTQVFPC